MRESRDGRRLVLIRHARPVIVPGEDASGWLMDASAREEVEELGTGLAGTGMDVVVTSDEPKARETGRLISAVLGVPLEVDADLREQGSGTIPWIDGAEAFRQRVLEHFAHPAERVFGEESSIEAGERFAAAVERWWREYCCPALVSHGRVMSAYLAKTTATDPIAFWLGLRMPDAFVVKPDVRRWRRIDKEERE